MIVKIHSRGAGAGSGPVDYLLGKDRDSANRPAYCAAILNMCVS
ncbi:hypothetical protein [Enterobacter cloacae]